MIQAARSCPGCSNCGTRLAGWGGGAGGCASQSLGVVWCVSGDACIYAGVSDGQTAQPLPVGTLSQGRSAVPERAGRPPSARRPVGRTAAASPSSAPWRAASGEKSPEWGRPRVLGAGRVAGGAQRQGLQRSGGDPSGGSERKGQGWSGCLAPGAGGQTPTLTPTSRMAPAPHASPPCSPRPAQPTAAPQPPTPRRHSPHLGVPRPGSPRPR